jgi:hypothetical protein
VNGETPDSVASPASSTWSIALSVESALLRTPEGGTSSANVLKELNEGSQSKEDRDREEAVLLGGAKAVSQEQRPGPSGQGAGGSSGKQRPPTQRSRRASPSPSSRDGAHTSRADQGRARDGVRPRASVSRRRSRSWGCSSSSRFRRSVSRGRRSQSGGRYRSLSGRQQHQQQSQLPERSA